MSCNGYHNSFPKGINAYLYIKNGHKYYNKLNKNMCIIVVKLSLSSQKHVRDTMFMTQLLANASYNDLLNIKRLKRRIKCRLS